MDHPAAPPPPERRAAVRWVASLMATAVYAAESLSRGLPVLGVPLAQDFLDGTRDLREWIVRGSHPAALVWSHLGGLSADIEDPYALAGETAAALPKPLPSRSVAELGEILSGLKQSIRVAFPELVQELALRARPIREQWEARGAGLMRECSSLTGISGGALDVEILLVVPLLSGGGRALLGYRRCFFEAVLVNPHPDLPEPVRLAWLIAQLYVDRPEYREATSPGRFPLVAQLALIPPVLIAAESVEWSEYRPELIRHVLAAWHVPTLPNRPAHEWLLHWWEHVRQDRLPWLDALKKLDEWLG